MAEQRPRRVKRRLTCTVRAGERVHRGLVLDASENGLFVQTNGAFDPGECVEVELPPLDGAAAFTIRARVARRKRVPPQLAGVVRHGVGLVVLEAPAQFRRLLDGARPVCEPAAPRTTAPKPASEAPPRPSFRVRVRQRGGARSRWLELSASSEREAIHRAEREVGAEWSVVEAVPV